MAKTKDDKNLWRGNANLYLAKEIVHCTDYLIKHQHSYPDVFGKKKAKSSGYSKYSEKKWTEILIEIRDGFKLYSDCDGDFYEWKNGRSPPDEPLDKTLARFNDQKNKYRVVLNKKKQRKFLRAMEFFAKYYEHLWD